MAQQLGLPSPLVIIQELQRLNSNLEAMQPDMHVIAQGTASIASLAQSMENFNPQEVNRLVTALDRASASGEQLYQQMWGGKQ